MELACHVPATEPSTQAVSHYAAPAPSIVVFTEARAKSEASASEVRLASVVTLPDCHRTAILPPYCHTATRFILPAVSYCHAAATYCRHTAATYCRHILPPCCRCHTAAILPYCRHTAPPKPSHPRRSSSAAHAAEALPQSFLALDTAPHTRPHRRPTPSSPPIRGRRRGSAPCTSSAARSSPSSR